ncbi:MAG: hypothetical protein H0X62_04950 [Bacteroidetes bacterium]|nr:hypothetical protein [Bacteroidota bacterium]
MNFVTEYPLWFIIFCILLGAAYSALLYFKGKEIRDAGKYTTPVLAGLRFLSVTILSFLLLGPLLKTVNRHTEKPIIILAQDNSESVVIGKNSLFFKNEYAQNLDLLIAELSNDYDVKSYSFGSDIQQGISYTYKDKETDISELFDEVNTRYSNTNVGALIIASDGLYNKGLNPVYKSQKINFPVFTIALGDTAVKKDVILSRVAHNRIAYMGNSFPLEIQADAKQFKGKTTVLTISKAGRTLFTQEIIIKDDKFTTVIPVMLEAKEVGIQRYKVKLSQLEDEISYVNNEKDIFIDVLDGRQKVLILANAPHPDIAALKQSIESNENYEVTASLASEFKKSVKEFNLVILHQLPSLNNGLAAILEELDKNKVPRLFILGIQSNINQFNNLQAGLQISTAGGRHNDSQVALTTDFSAFTLTESTAKALRRFPPLSAPFGTYKATGSASVVFNQRIGMVETKDPLLLFNAAGDAKTGVIAGEGVWRWRISDFSENKNHNAFNELVSKVVQYLSVKADKSLFRVNAKTDFYENQAVEFDAELYDDIYELINEPEVSLTITNAEKNKFPFVFSKTANAYRLNAGIFPVGEYKWEAKVKAGDKILAQSGEFSVSALQIEALNTQADHGLLFNLSKKHGGQMVYPNEMQSLASLITNREDIKPVVYSQQRLNEMINLKWVFFLILLLLSFEWFVRKRSGAY